MLNLNSEGPLSDAIDDFEIFVNNSIDLRIKPLVANNEILGNPYSTSSSFYVFPYALNEGETISSNANGTWFDNGLISGIQDLNYSSGLRGNWKDVQDRYLGLRFKIGGNTHYGWAKLDVGLSGASWSIKEYAYNTIPDDPINAGQKVLGLQESSLNKTKIIALNKSISIYNLPQETKYRLFNMSGQNVLDGKTVTKTHNIEASTLSKGIYIIELQDSDSKAVIRKKIVL